MTEQESLIEFPCDFPIKVMGPNREGFAQIVVEIVQRHDPAFQAASLRMRSSRAGNYLSVTAVIQATSRAQLDRVYQDLSTHPMVSMVL